jgi:hypothetical protein
VSKSVATIGSSSSLLLSSLNLRLRESSCEGFIGEGREAVEVVQLVPGQWTISMQDMVRLGLSSRAQPPCLNAVWRRSVHEAPVGIHTAIFHFDNGCLGVLRVAVQPQSTAPERF